MLVILGEIIRSSTTETDSNIGPPIRVRRIERPTSEEDQDAAVAQDGDVEQDVTSDELKHWRLYRSL